MAEFNSRREYASERRGVVISQLIKENSFEKYTKLVEKEVELDSIIIDKIAYHSWNRNIDVGFAIVKKKLCLQFSVWDKKKHKFESKETIQYSTEIDLTEWTLRCVWEYYLKTK